MASADPGLVWRVRVQLSMPLVGMPLLRRSVLPVVWCEYCGRALRCLLLEVPALHEGQWAEGFHHQLD